MKKKKKHLEPIQPTELAQQYYNLWQQLNRAHEEPEIDSIRRQMSGVWKQMVDADKTAFHSMTG